MFTTDSTSGEDRWGHLQQPARLSGNEPRLRLLLAALDQGWCIEGPIYLRPRWGDAGGRVYHFILHRPGHAPRLITVPENVATTAFVTAEQLPIVK